MTEPSWWTYLKLVAGTEDGQTIAEAAGVSAPQVSRWKAGKNRPDADKLAAFARYFGRSPIEAFIAAGYIGPDESGGVVELSPLPIADLDDAELLAELATRLSLRRSEYERLLIQMFVAVGQLQSLVDAMETGEEDEEISSISDHLGVLVHSIHQAAAEMTVDKARLNRLTAEAALELRTRQTGRHVVSDSMKHDLVSQISAWPFDYSNVRQLHAGIDYVREDEIARSKRRKSSPSIRRSMDPAAGSGGFLGAAARTAPPGYAKGESASRPAADGEENQDVDASLDDAESRDVLERLEAHTTPEAMGVDDSGHRRHERG